MRNFENGLAALLWTGLALLLPMAALEPVGQASARLAASGLAFAACEDGSAHLVMGCASILL